MSKEKKAKESKESKEKFKVIKAILIGGNVSSNTKEAMNLFGSQRFGEISESKIIYSLPEALYLAEKGRIHVYEKSKKLSFQNLIEKALEVDSKLSTKFPVFRDLRNRGYIVKTALKFGAEFRVYDKGIHPGKDHAKWILYPVRESESLTWHDFSAKNRVAHSTKKNLLIAIVDDEGEVVYYEVSWTRP